MGGGIGTWIVYGILAIVAFFVIKWLLALIFGMVMGLLHIAITVAIIVGIIYLCVVLFGRKKVAY